MIVASSNMQRNPPVSVSCIDIPCTIDQRPDTLLQVKGISFKLEKSIFWTRQTNKKHLSHPTGQEDFPVSQA